jgi:hypothetical protein
MAMVAVRMAAAKSLFFIGAAERYASSGRVSIRDGGKSQNPHPQKSEGAAPGKFVCCGVKSSA